MYGLVTLPLIPMRANPEERSEMVTQLLFGEVVRIQEELEKWLYVSNVVDGYGGWVDKKMIRFMTDEDQLSIQRKKPVRIQKPFVRLHHATGRDSLYLPCGSLLYDLDGSRCRIAGEEWHLETSLLFVENSFFSARQVLNVAFQFLHAPYLWGGKTILGIDCSGLVQLVFAVGGYNLPRDASQQVSVGTQVESLTEALPGDIAFFGDAKGAVSHVGILVDDKHILHASGWVKIENIDTRGILPSVHMEYSHHLKAIRRVIDSR